MVRVQQQVARLPLQHWAYNRLDVQQRAVCRDGIAGSSRDMLRRAGGFGAVLAPCARRRRRPEVQLGHAHPGALPKAGVG